MSHPTTQGQFMRAAAWLQRYELFRTRASLDWFIRTHRKELIDAGELLPGRYEDWVILARERLRLLRLHALELLSQRLLSEGQVV